MDARVLVHVAGPGVEPQFRRKGVIPPAADQWRSDTRAPRIRRFPPLSPPAPLLVAIPEAKGRPRREPVAARASKSQRARKPLQEFPASPVCNPPRRRECRRGTCGSTLRPLRRQDRRSRRDDTTILVIAGFDDEASVFEDQAQRIPAEAEIIVRVAVDGKSLMGDDQKCSAGREHSRDLLRCDPRPLQMLPNGDGDEGVESLAPFRRQRVDVSDNIDVGSGLGVQPDVVLTSHIREAGHRVRRPARHRLKRTDFQNAAAVVLRRMRPEPGLVIRFGRVSDGCGQRNHGLAFLVVGSPCRAGLAVLAL